MWHIFRRIPLANAKSGFKHLWLFIIIAGFIIGCVPHEGEINNTGTAKVREVKKEKSGLTEETLQKDFGRKQERMEMVAEQIAGRGITDKNVLKAMQTVPRHLFVPSGYNNLAYGDYPLPIGFAQTISQPYIVAYMSDVLDLANDSKVLEVGTGSGYQAAVLSMITPNVYTVEIIPELAAGASKRLKELGYTVKIKEGDGYYGWKEYAPYDAIIVTAAASHIPSPLIEQLKHGGRMIIPVGAALYTQYLVLLKKNEDGTIVKRKIMPVKFVPLTGEHSY